MNYNNNKIYQEVAYNLEILNTKKVIQNYFNKFSFLNPILSFKYYKNDNTVINTNLLHRVLSNSPPQFFIDEYKNISQKIIVLTRFLLKQTNNAKNNKIDPIHKDCFILWLSHMEKAYQCFKQGKITKNILQETSFNLSYKLNLSKYYKDILNHLIKDKESTINNIFFLYEMHSQHNPIESQQEKTINLYSYALKKKINTGLKKSKNNKIIINALLEQENYFKTLVSIDVFRNINKNKISSLEEKIKNFGTKKHNNILQKYLETKDNIKKMIDVYYLIESFNQADKYDNTDIFSYINNITHNNTKYDYLLIAQKLGFNANKAIDKKANNLITKVAEKKNLNKTTKKGLDILLKNTNIDINHKNNEGDNALLIAIKNKNISMIKYLLNNNCNIDISNVKGQTPLMLSTELDQYPFIFEYLLKNSNDINKKDNKGNDLSSYLENKSIMMNIYLKNQSNTIKEKPNTNHKKIL